MVQLLQINPSAASNGESIKLAGSPAPSNGQLPVQADPFAVERLVAELNEHRYNIERKVEQRTEQLMRRLSLLESCNASLCGKLAQAKRDIAALHLQLAHVQSGAELNDCHGQLSA